MSSARRSPLHLDDPDRTARARIRDAAFARFAADGVAATSVKSIADDVGVSPALVIHHFGSKEGLRAACDEYVLAGYRQLSHDATSVSLDPLQVVRQVDDGLPIVRYLARTLAEASPHVAELIDELVETALANYPDNVERGIAKPTDHPREITVLLMTWQLGMLVLHEHVERLLGVDLTGDDSDGWLKLALPMVEILAKGVLREEFYEQWREATQTALRSRTDMET